MKNKANGFTLIEVLIALVILAIALTALIKVTSQNIKDTTYLQNKTIAMWVATLTINEARTGMIKLPVNIDAEKEETEMLGRKWLWSGRISSTPNPNIKKIEVSVYQNDETKLINLTSYMYVPAQPQTH